MENNNEIQVNFSVHKGIFLMPDSVISFMQTEQHYIYFYYQDRQ